MATITIEIPDELVARAEELRELLPALLALSLEPPALCVLLAHSPRRIVERQRFITMEYAYEPEGE